jgi:hypothetical protein
MTTLRGVIPGREYRAASDAVYAQRPVGPSSAPTLTPPEFAGLRGIARAVESPAEAARERSAVAGHFTRKSEWAIRPPRGRGRGRRRMNRLAREGIEERRRISEDRNHQNETIRAWMAAYLSAVRPAPNQLRDSLLGSYIAIKKGAAMRFYGRTARLERQPHGTIITATIDCAGASPKALKRAFSRAHRVQLDQMMRKDMPAGGVILDADVADDGRVGLRAVITDPTAAAKALHAVYSGLLIELDGDEVEQISLVDSPSDFVTKARRPTSSAKYSQGQE